MKVIPKNLNPAGHPQPTLKGHGSLWVGSFQAMASDCEVLCEGLSKAQVSAVVRDIAIETWRIEAKFSRYRSDNMLYAINHSAGKPVEVDIETQGLLDFAAQCFELSDGMFDVTSGVLRKIWRFDGGTTVPSDAEIDAIKAKIGWQHTTWKAPFFTLPDGMEIDFGGLGKEYAVDRALIIAMTHIEKIQKQVSPQTNAPRPSAVVNFGGDIACSGARMSGEPWVIGVESCYFDKTSVATISIAKGGVASSGDARRFIMHEGKKLPHILDPRTARPVAGAPKAISVAGHTCMQAGMLSTFAMLHGGEAEAFLQAQGVQYWLQ